MLELHPIVDLNVLLMLNVPAIGLVSMKNVLILALDPVVQTLTVL
jgi:hypothetical protein